jgi:hypothetical protein
MFVGALTRRVQEHFSLTAAAAVARRWPGAASASAAGDQTGVAVAAAHTLRVCVSRRAAECPLACPVSALQD